MATLKSFKALADQAVQDKQQHRVFQTSSAHPTRVYYSQLDKREKDIAMDWLTDKGGLYQRLAAYVIS